MRVAVYSIALNEEKHVSRWYESSKEADYHLICDTGSTDNTIEIAKSLGINTVSTYIKPFRFDDARNFSLFSLPEDIDYCIALDVDEVLQPGWREELEKAFADGIDKPQYRFIVEFDENDNPSLEFNGFRIHRRHGVRWVNPIHEVPEVYDGTCISKKYNFEIHHRPDKDKLRSQYLPMLQMAVKENPSSRNLYYLGREYYFYRMFDKSSEHLNLYLEKSVFNAEKSHAMRMLSKCEPDKEEYWLKMAVETYKCRESLLQLAHYYYYNQKWQECIDISEEALKIVEKPEEFLSEAWAWGNLAYDLLSICYWQIGDFEGAYKNGLISLEMSPNDERLANNLLFYEEKLKETKNL